MRTMKALEVNIYTTKYICKNGLVYLILYAKLKTNNTKSNTTLT